MIKPVFGIWIHVGDDILVSYGVFDMMERKREERILRKQMNEFGLTLIQVHLLVPFFFLPLSFHKTKDTMFMT
jgi:hypothetical protein